MIDEKSGQRKLGSVLGYIYTGMQAVISILYIPILLQGIGKSEYGLYQILGSIIAYFSVMEGPLSASVLRYYAAYKAVEDSNRMENTLAIGKRLFWAISAFVLLISIPCIFIFRGVYADALSMWEINEATWMFAIMIINIVISMNSYVYVAAINANECYVFLKITSIVLLCMQPLAVVCVIIQFPYATTIVVVQVILNLILAFIRRQYALHRLNVKIIYHGADRQILKKLLMLSMSVFVVAIADQIFWKTDQLILGAMYGTATVAIYSIGAQLNSMYIGIACVLGGMLLPTITRISKSAESEKQLSDYFSKIGRYQSFLVCLILSGVILFGQEFILLIAGTEYMPAYWVALFLMIPYSVDLIQICGCTILQVKDKYHVRSIIMFAMAAINIALTIIMARKIGMIGAALATTVTILTGCGIGMNYFYYKKMKINIKDFWKGVLPIWVVAAGTACCSVVLNMLRFDNLYLQFIVHVLLYCIVYCIAMFALAMNRNEKELITQIVKSITKNSR